MQRQDRHRNFTSRAIAYLKTQIADDNGPVIALSQDDSPVLRPFSVPLLASYVVDAGESYEFVQNRHLVEDGIDEEALHRIGLENLAQLLNDRSTRVQPYGNIFAVMMGGDFEASLILLDPLWDEHFRQFVSGDYAVVVPARDVLAFCDASSTAGVDELRQVVHRVFPDGDHLLSDRVHVRRQGTWEPLSNN